MEKQNTLETEDLKYPPTLEGELQKYKDKCANYEVDNVYSLFFAMNRKAGEIATSLNDTEIDLKKEDKAFERFIKLVEKLDVFVATLAKLRQDYLKIPENEVEAASKNKIPILERHGTKVKK